MHFMRRLFMLFIIPMIMLALVACGTATPATAPTSVPQSTQPPATALPPTSEAATSTTEAPALQTKPVVIGDLTTYAYDTGLFSIDIPDNWSLRDTSKAGEAILLWTDPTENGLIAVDLFEEAQPQTEEELVDFLQSYLQNTFQGQADFSMDDPKPQSDGSVLIVWSYTAEASGGIQTKLLGNSFIEQREDKISILTTAVPAEQFDALLDSTNAIINSYRIDPSAALP